MLRKALIPALVGAILAVGTPTIVAQDQLSVGSITGRTIDVAGRPMGAQRVELLQGSQAISTANTNAFGEWSFRDVKPGEYVVRVNINGKISGVRVSVSGGQLVANMLIVVSTATVSPQIGALGTLLSTLAPSVVTAVTTAAAAAGYETETTELNEEILEDILEEMAPAERVAFAQAVLEAVEESQGSASPFAQYVAQLQVIVVTQGTTVPEFPPPTSVS